MYAIDPSSLAEETVQQQLLHLAKDIMGYPKPAATLAVPSPRPPQGAPGGPQGGPPGGPHGADSQEVENVRLQEGGRAASEVWRGGSRGSRELIARNAAARSRELLQQKQQQQQQQQQQQHESAPVDEVA
ncbi:hypothetical protein ETH_00034150 [Eimeria tenella]|uniref:Uncharacterized protein n=1 Tax=Eimeria tenella TaxID=5802 RepID=U6L3L6_EIMTE|nr:hypothetical protein ETH_00034150 [Eimeria tenella]CDJ44957.1 hypothetical protein ETH_00034150 [Eimeria tenella]|eukprot:XP_013235704.1 hypothetical protein ETH_00034150 [Eimeria tenella]